jgi:hypothetical protein
MKAHQHWRRADFRVAGNQNFTLAAIFDPILSIGSLDVQNRTYRKLIERHAALYLRLADGAIDGVVKVRMGPEGLGLRKHVHDCFTFCCS